MRGICVAGLPGGAGNNEIRGKMEKGRWGVRWGGLCVGLSGEAGGVGVVVTCERGGGFALCGVDGDR